jgi:hypothetical protein
MEHVVERSDDELSHRLLHEIDGPIGKWWLDGISRSPRVLAEDGNVTPVA